MKIIHWCKQHVVPLIVIFPRGSFLQDIASWNDAASARDEHSQLVSTDLCAFGGRQPLRSNIFGCYVPDISHLHVQCHMHKGVCDFSGRPHAHARGRASDSSGTKSLTREPPKLMAALAEFLLEGMRALKEKALFERMKRWVRLQFFEEVC